jgi:hypothetical protein
MRHRDPLLQRRIKLNCEKLYPFPCIISIDGTALA